jgi:hypothetical protein
MNLTPRHGQWGYPGYFAGSAVEGVLPLTPPGLENVILINDIE